MSSSSVSGHLTRRLAANSHEQYFRSLLKGLPFDGCERSLKFSRGVLLHRRLLAGLHRSDVTDSTLLQMCSSLGMPAAMQERLRREWGPCNVVHFGYEQGVTGCAFKVYLEFGLRLVQSQRQPPEQRQAFDLHLAFKWNPEQPASGVVAHYNLLPGLTMAQMLGRLEPPFFPHRADAARQVLRELLHAVLMRLEEPAMFLQVSEEGLPRQSFDVSCYGSGLSLADIEPALQQLAQSVAVEPSWLKQELQPVCHCALGHIAAGVDRLGSEFATIYHSCDADFGPGLDPEQRP